MGNRRVNITFTEKEFEFISNKALLRNKTVWTLIQSDVNKMFSGIEVDAQSCDGSSKRIIKPIDIPDRLWRNIICASKKLGMTPTQLVYRIIIAPHLVEIATQGRLVAEVKSPD